MDVFCIGMYRSGSTWQYHVVSHLLEQHRGGRRLGIVTGPEYARTARGEPGEWRVLKTHAGHPAFAEALASGRALAVYSFRDLRDVAYSLMHKFAGSFEEIVERKNLLHVCLDNDAFWTSQPRTLTQRYETIMTEPVPSVQALAVHLGIELSEGEAQAVAEEYSLKANAWRTIELANRLREEGVDLEDPANTIRFDRQSLLHWNHIRSGRVGGWRAEAAPRDLAVLAGVCGTWLIARGYEPDLAWALPALAHLQGELEATQRALHEARTEVARQTRQMQELHEATPVALGLAQRFHKLSARYPRLAATLKRLLRPLAGNAPAR
jgi:hypothetical protein